MDDDKKSREVPAAQPKSDPPEAAESTGAAEKLGDRVRAQRRHIEGLTGQDPLRAGIDD